MSATTSRRLNDPPRPSASDGRRCRARRPSPVLRARMTSSRRNTDLIEVAVHGALAGPAPPSCCDGLRSGPATLTVLDPTCGCGEFLAGGAAVLERSTKLACRTAVTAGPGSPGPGPGADAGLCTSCVASILRQNLHGLDLMPEAVEIARMRLTPDAGGRVAGRPRATQAACCAGHALRPRRRRVSQPARRSHKSLRRGGFAVIVGNPPYVERGMNPRLAGYRTAACGNLYAPVVERSLSLLAPDGRLGMIVPHSAFCTDRMAPLLVPHHRRSDHLGFDLRHPPVQAVRRRRSAARHLPAARLARNRGPIRPAITAGRRPNGRSSSQGLRYLDVSDLRYENSIPKAGDPIEVHIWHKIHRPAPLARRPRRRRRRSTTTTPRATGCGP